MVKVTKDEISRVMSVLGRKGGKVKSEAKTLAVRENARKPRKRKKTNRVA